MYATYTNTFDASLFIVFSETIYTNANNSALINKCAYNITSTSDEIILIVRRAASLVRYLFYSTFTLSAPLIIRRYKFAIVRINNIDNKSKDIANTTNSIDYNRVIYRLVNIDINVLIKIIINLIKSQ